MANSYAKTKGRRMNELFVKLPHRLLDSPAWQDLSPRAKDIFIRLNRKYNGHNNGDLSMPLSELKRKRVACSSQTLTKALDELWSHGFIVLTREGSFGASRICNLWAVTTSPIHENYEKGIKGTQSPSNDWKIWSPEQPAPDYRMKFPKVQAKRKRQSPRLSQAA